MKNKNLIVITIVGKDRIGLVAGVTRDLAKINANIVDVEQSVVHGLFSIFMLLVAIELLIKNFNNTGLDILQSELKREAAKFKWT